MGVVAEVVSCTIGLLTGDWDAMGTGYFLELYAMSENKIDSASHCVCC